MHSHASEQNPVFGWEKIKNFFIICLSNIQSFYPMLCYTLTIRNAPDKNLWNSFLNLKCTSAGPVTSHTGFFLCICIFSCLFPFLFIMSVFLHLPMFSYILIDRPAALSLHKPMRNDNLGCQEVGVFNMVHQLRGSINPQLVGIDIDGCQLRWGNPGQKGIIKGNNG